MLKPGLCSLALLLALFPAGRLEAEPSLWDDPPLPPGQTAPQPYPLDANGWPVYTPPPQGVLLADPDRPSPASARQALPQAPYRTGISGPAVSAAAQAAALGLAAGLAGGSVAPGMAASRTIQTLAGAVSNDPGQGHGH